MRLPICLLLLLSAVALRAQTPPAVEPTPTDAPPVMVQEPTPQPAPEPVAQPAPELAVAAPVEAPVATMLVYRQKRMAGAILNTSVFVDDVEIADMDNGTYLRVKVTPGEHAIYADEKKDLMMFAFEAGKTYYFRMALRAGLWKGHGKLEPVDPVSGEKEFNNWKPKLVYAKDIRKPELVILD